MAKDLNSLLKRTGEALAKLQEGESKRQRLEEERNDLIANIGKNVADLLRPLMERIAKMSRLNKEDIKEAISELNISVPPPTIPPIQVPKIEVPAPRVTVRAPDVVIPEEMKTVVVGHSIDFKKPIPVVLTNDQGKSYIAGAIGGGGNFTKLRFQGVDSQGIYRTASVDEGGRLQVDIVSGGGGGTQYQEDAAHTSGDTGTLALGVRRDTASSLVDADGDYTAPIFDANNRMHVILPSSFVESTITVTDDVANMDLPGKAAFLMGWDASGNAWDRVRQSGVASDGSTSHSQGALGVQGHNYLYNVTNGNWDRMRGGPGYSDSALRVVHASDIAMSVSVTSVTASTVVVGSSVADAADDGSAPVKMGGIARTANPSAVAGGDAVSATMDDLGRQVFTPMQVRDLRATAFATLNSNSETTLISGIASTFLDLVWIKFSNTSSGAITVDLRNGTGGTIVDTWEIPANGVVGAKMPFPWPQDEVASAWTVDFNDADVSNTTVYVSALFSKEA